MGMGIDVFHPPPPNRIWTDVNLGLAETFVSPRIVPESSQRWFCPRVTLV